MSLALRLGKLHGLDWIAGHHLARPAKQEKQLVFLKGSFACFLNGFPQEIWCFAFSTFLLENRYLPLEIMAASTYNQDRCRWMEHARAADVHAHV